MPTYEYACKTCGNRFEAWQKITDEPLHECPKCHAEVHRVLFPAGVVFKGSGFYSTDNRGHTSDGDNAERSAAKSGETESGTTETKSETKAETKSESKSETKSESTAAQPNEAAKAS
jgi:putative FmdB family regulatory protein